MAQEERVATVAWTRDLSKGLKTTAFQCFGGALWDAGVNCYLFILEVDMLPLAILVRIHYIITSGEVPVASARLPDFDCHLVLKHEYSVRLSGLTFPSMCAIVRDMHDVRVCAMCAISNVRDVRKLSCNLCAAHWPHAHTLEHLESWMVTPTCMCMRPLD
jgi:hypothetical protein